MFFINCHSELFADALARREHARNLHFKTKVLVVGRKEETMYTGTLIEDLMKAVETAERRSLQARSEEEKLAHFYAVAQSELTQSETLLAGAA